MFATWKTNWTFSFKPFQDKSYVEKRLWLLTTTPLLYSDRYVTFKLANLFTMITKIGERVQFLWKMKIKSDVRTLVPILSIVQEIAYSHTLDAYEDNYQKLKYLHC